MQLIENLAGGYRFAAGIAPYSSGVVAMPGYEIVRVTLHAPLALAQGFSLIERWLDRQERPRAALCAMELRLPNPLTFDAFIAFNNDYQQVLESWDLMVDGRNPVARTNIAPVVRPPLEAVLYAFSFTRPTTEENGPSTFVIAGAGDLRDQAELSPAAIVRPGETSPEAMQEKAAAVMRVMQERLDAIGETWSNVTAVTVYSAQPIQTFLPNVILSTMGPATAHGVHWYFSNPPIAGLEFEMDMRGVRCEKQIDGEL